MKFTEWQLRRMSDMEVADIGAKELGVSFLSWGEKDRRAQLTGYLRAKGQVVEEEVEPDPVYIEHVIDLSSLPEPQPSWGNPIVKKHCTLGKWVWDPDAVERIVIGSRSGGWLVDDVFLHYTSERGISPGAALLFYLSENPQLVPAQWGDGPFFVMGDIVTCGVARIDYIHCMRRMTPTLILWGYAHLHGLFRWPDQVLVINPEKARFVR